MLKLNIFSMFTRLKLITCMFEPYVCVYHFKALSLPFSKKTFDFENSLKNIWIINNFVWKDQKY